MVSKVFAVYDSKAGIYKRPFMALTTAHGIRLFEDACCTADTEVARHPGDFTLFEIGEFDDNTGTYTMRSAHLNLGKAIEFVNKGLDNIKPLPPKNVVADNLNDYAKN